MKKTVQLLLFILAFQVEVRVRASGDVLQQPSACMASQQTCAIQVVGSAFHLEKGALKLHAGAGSALVRLSEKQWRFVKGSMWIEKAEKFEIETLFGAVQAKKGQYWVLDQGEHILIRNMTADLTVTLRDGKVLEIPDGFEFWIGGVNSQGKSEYGMIRPIDMKEHLPLWNSLYRGSKEAFVKDVLAVRESWGDLAERSGGLYASVAQRAIASVTAQEETLRRERERKAAQARQVRELYRQRVFER